MKDELQNIKHLQVIAFAKAMDEVLTKNDYKGGWQECSVEYLRHRLMEEIGEYFAWVEGADGWGETKKKKKQKELINETD